MFQLPEEHKVRIVGISDSEVRAALNLQPLIEAHRVYRENPSDISEKHLAKVLNAYKSQFDSMGGHLIWTEIVKEHFKLSDDVIHNAHSCVLLGDSFFELFKNSIDAFIHAYLEGRINEPELSVSVKLNRYTEELINFTITDNAGGMPESVLDDTQLLIQDKDKLLESKRHASDKSVAFSFGGQGLGLRLLIAGMAHGLRTERGRTLIPSHQIPDDDSVSIRLYNNPDGDVQGLTIDLTSPVTPLEELSDEQFLTSGPSSDSDSDASQVAFVQMSSSVAPSTLFSAEQGETALKSFSEDDIARLQSKLSGVLEEIHTKIDKAKDTKRLKLTVSEIAKVYKALDGQDNLQEKIMQNLKLLTKRRVKKAVKELNDQSEVHHSQRKPTV